MQDTSYKALQWRYQHTDCFVHAPDSWRIAGIAKRTDNPFEYETVYRKDGNDETRESVLLEKGIADVRYQSDRHTQISYSFPN